MLDKSRGLALGAELVTNGDFASGTTGWSDITASLSVVGGEGVVTAASGFGYVRQVITTVVGKTYQVTCSARVGTTNRVTFSLGGTAAETTSSTTTSLRLLYTATATSANLWLQVANAGTAIFDNISVRELAGNHATQATIAARPTYSIEPVGGRRNLLLQTEAPTNAAWVTSGTSTVTSGITDPDGGSTAFTVKNTGAGSAARYQVATVVSGQTYTNSIWLRRRLGTGTISVLAINGQGGVGQAVTLTSAWQRFVAPAGFTNVASSTTGYMGFEIGTAGDEIDIWHPQLETGSTATNYQRVTTQHDVTEAGVASVSYLYFDGADDAMATSTITPGIDKAQVFAGVRKLSDAVGSIVGGNGNTAVQFEILSTGWSTPASKYGAAFYTNALSIADTAANFAPPRTDVLAWRLDTAGAANTDRLKLNVNAAPQTLNMPLPVTATANFTALPLYINARSGTSLFFQGHLYSLVVRFGANLDATVISSTETFVAGKTGVTL
jgi:hypothetical protein